MNKLALLIFSALIQIHTEGRNPTEEEREARFTYDIPSTADIRLEGKEIYLEVETWTENKVEVFATVLWKGGENERVRAFLENFEVEVGSKIRSSPTGLAIDADHQEQRKVEERRAFGSTIYNEDDLELTYKLKIPVASSLSISNSYDDIVLNGQFDGKVEINQYSGRFTGGSFSSLEINMKYGSAEIESVDILTGELYENDLEVESVTEGDLQAKYSKLELRQSGTLYLNAYECRIRGRQVDRLEGEYKYGSIEIEGAINEVDVRSIYEMELEFESAQTISIEQSKYSSLIVGEVSALDLKDSYEDDISVDAIGRLTGRSKYTDFEIGELSGSMVLMEVYEGEIQIDRVQASATEISVDCKYCNLEMGTVRAPFQLSAKLQYGNVDYDMSSLQRRIYIKENDRLEIEAATDDYSEGDLIVKLTGYEFDVELR